MGKIIPIGLEAFKKKFRTPNIEEDILKLFRWSDIEWFYQFGQKERLRGVNRLPNYILFSLRHPNFIFSFLLPQVLSLLFGKGHKDKTDIDIKDLPFVKNEILKASIAASFKPKRVLEIGTYLGVGAASFKAALPKTSVFTMCPKDNKAANNPLDSKFIGYFFKKKKLQVTQIWADSTKFDFSNLPLIDFTFIDGNHQYEYVYKDLTNTSKITRLAILVDDCITQKEAKNWNLNFGPWNEGVVRAVDVFLKENPSSFKQAYWIEGTKFCVLIK